MERVPGYATKKIPGIHFLNATAVEQIWPIISPIKGDVTGLDVNRRTMTDKPDDQLIVPCAGCGVKILSWWAPDNRGLLSGEYVIIADTLWHPKCWDKQIENYNPNG